MGVLRSSTLIKGVAGGRTVEAADLADLADRREAAEGAGSSGYSVSSGKGECGLSSCSLYRLIWKGKGFIF